MQDNAERSAPNATCLELIRTAIGAVREAVIYAPRGALTGDLVNIENQLIQVLRAVHNDGDDGA